MPHFPLSLRIVAVGKLRKSHFARACDDYRERLLHYMKVEVIEIRDSVGKGRPDPQAIRDEGLALLKSVRPSSKVVALDKKGVAHTSRGLAKWLRRQIDSGNRDLDFVIGGPLGLSDEISASAHERLSLSPMTFPHELARVILLEQLYRACTILRGESYHK